MVAAANPSNLEKLFRDIDKSKTRALTSEQLLAYLQGDSQLHNHFITAPQPSSHSCGATKV